MTVLRELIARIKLDSKRARSDLKDYDDKLGKTKEKTKEAQKETKKFGDEAQKSAKKAKDSGRKISNAFKRATESAKGLAGGVKTAGSAVVKGLAVVTTATAAASAGIFALTKDWAEATDEIGKRAGKLGVSAQSLQELRHVAELSGAEAESLSDALKEVQIRSAEAAKTGTGPFAEAADKLGLSLADLARQSPVKTFEDIRRELSLVQGSTEKTSLSVALLGEQGIELGEVINLTEEQFQGFRKEARELGGVLGDDALANAANFNDELARTNVVLGSIRSEVSNELAPVVQDILKDFRKWIQENRKLARKEVVNTIKELTRAGIELGKLLFDLIKGLNELSKAAGGLDNVVRGLAGAFVAFKLAALGPIGLVAGAFAGLITLVDTYDRKVRRAAKAADEAAKKRVLTDEEREALGGTEEGRGALSRLDRANAKIDRTVDNLEALEANERLTFDEFSQDDAAERKTLEDARRERKAAEAERDIAARDARAALKLIELDRQDAATAAKPEEVRFGLLSDAEVQRRKEAERRKRAARRENARLMGKGKGKKKDKKEEMLTMGELLGLGKGGAKLSSSEGRGLGTTIINQHFNIGIPSIKMEIAAAPGATVNQQAKATVEAIGTMMPDIVKRTQRAAIGELS